MHLKIASRSSDLARWQAIKVGSAIKARHPETTIEYVFRSSFGDQNLDLPLSQMESRGVFTQDFYQDLKNGLFDMVVHSWKDLPVEDREGTQIVATLERADVRDVFLVPKDLWQKARETGRLKILTSSPRRIFNLEPWIRKLLPLAIENDLEVEFVPVRGNIPSRLDKMFSQEAGLILAKAALDRMLAGGEEFEEVKAKTKEKVSRCHFMVLPLEINPCAPAQGALAIEIASHREDLKELFKSLNHESSFRSVEIEREILKSHGGGCHQKIGVVHLAKPFGVYHIEKGESEWGIKLERRELLKEASPQNLREENSSSVFPLDAKDNSWFERKALPQQNSQPFQGKAVLVARIAEGLPDLREAAQVWTPGLSSWLKLARQGVWVNGCFEGLGEQERAWVGPTAENLDWVKLSHQLSESKEDLKVLPFYELQEKTKESSPDLRGKKFFYWMSSSAFHRAYELYPKEISEGFHGCGPGITFEKLKTHPALKAPPQIFLDLQEFHEYLKRNGLRF